jgi:hypothetical protein
MTASKSGRKVLWRAPQNDKYGDAVRTSKCGRYRIVTLRMASARNGFWNAKAYRAERAGGKQIGTLQDYLVDALDLVEFDNNPEWEPPT